MLVFLNTKEYDMYALTGNTFPENEILLQQNSHTQEESF